MSDLVKRFSFTHAPIRGQWVKLERVLVDTCAHQTYSPDVATLLAQMLAAVAMIADGMKFTGAVALQFRGDGEISTILAECRERHLLRGIARFKDSATGDSIQTPLKLLGNGQLAISLIDEGQIAPYQGMVSLEHPQLAQNLESYFRNSEQLDTKIYLTTTPDQATGLLLQKLPLEQSLAEHEEESQQALWEEICILADTVSDTELADLPPATLLGRLFAEHSISIHPSRSLEFRCTCSREKSSGALQALPTAEIVQILAEEGEITVTCEFCGVIYRYKPEDAQSLIVTDNSTIH